MNNGDEIITIWQLVNLQKELDNAKLKAIKLENALSAMLELHTGLEVGMSLIINEDAHKHLRNAPDIKVGDLALLTGISVSIQREGIDCIVEYSASWGTNIQSLECAQSMRNDYLKSLESNNE